MEEQKFLNWCAREVCDCSNSNSDNTQITKEDVFVVWRCKTSRISKALLCTALFDGMYYMCTYNKDNKEMYVDVYKKEKNSVARLIEREV